MLPAWHRRAIANALLQILDGAIRARILAIAPGVPLEFPEFAAHAAADQVRRRGQNRPPSVDRPGTPSHPLSLHSTGARDPKLGISSSALDEDRILVFASHHVGMTASAAIAGEGPRWPAYEARPGHDRGRAPSLSRRVSTPGPDATPAMTARPFPRDRRRPTLQPGRGGVSRITPPQPQTGSGVPRAPARAGAGPRLSPGAVLPPDSAGRFPHQDSRPYPVLRHPPGEISMGDDLRPFLHPFTQGT